MKLLLITALLALAGPAFGYEVKPEAYDPWKIIGSTPARRFDMASPSRATPEQFRVAMMAAHADLAIEAARQTAEVQEGGEKWQVLDYNPREKDKLHNYTVQEMVQYRKWRKYTPFVVRTNLSGYSPEGNWAWHAKKYVRYLVYVDDNNKVLALKRTDFESTIDFYEWKLKIQEEDAKKAKAMRPVGYSTELYEEAAPAAAEAATSAE